MAVPTRAQWIADARAVLDLLESNPELPLNLAVGLNINYYPLTAEGDIEATAAVDAIADKLGVAVTPPGPGSHYEAKVRFGSASYKAVTVLKDYREKRDAIERLGKAALEAAEQAARPVEHVDYAEAEDVRQIKDEMALEAAGVESWEEL
jgi:hypothetical protein